MSGLGLLAASSGNATGQGTGTTYAIAPIPMTPIYTNELSFVRRFLGPLVALLCVLLC